MAFLLVCIQGEGTIQDKGTGEHFLLERMFETPHSGEAIYFPHDFLNRGTWTTFVGTVLHSIPVASHEASVADELELLDCFGEEEKQAMMLRYLAKHMVPYMSSTVEQEPCTEQGHGDLTEEQLSRHNNFKRG